MGKYFQTSFPIRGWKRGSSKTSLSNCLVFMFCFLLIGSILMGIIRIFILQNDNFDLIFRP